LRLKVDFPGTAFARWRDPPVGSKRVPKLYYRGQNILAQSLSADTYDHNPGFRRFLDSSGLNFHAHDKFKKADIEGRTTLYRRLAETIWDPAL